MKVHKYLLISVVLIISHSINAQWENPSLNLTGRAILCFTNSNSAVLSGTDGGLVRSTDNGTSWVNAGGGLPYSNVRALLNVESYPFNLLAGMVSGKISMSTNYGENFTGFPVDSVQLPFLASVNSILERTNSSEFWVGTERGAFVLPQYYPLSLWIPINTGLPSSETKVRAIIENNGEIFAGTNSGVFQLNGFSWVEKNTGLTNLNVTALRSINGLLIAGTAQGSVGGVYISSDNGENWVLSLSNPWVTSILTIGSNIFAGTFGDGIWRSTNNGNTWGQINDGLGSGAYYVLSLGVDEQYIFAGTNGSNIWRRPLSQVVTGIEDESNIQTKEYSLEQNYPNPFNPSTKIKYTIPSVGTSLMKFVQLKVYDVLGNEVATLLNEEKPAGSYELTFDASALSSGIYLYKLTVGSFIQTKKMIFVK
ncbi:MAG: T9SS type A sorting domain-containing protein [Ignavibacteriales bacterium]